MFIHVVLFEIAPGEVKDYRADSKMWARHATQAAGFISYHTMKRYGHDNQYASVYEWKSKSHHDRFMRKHHDALVEKSKAKVRVEGYYNLKSIDRVAQ